jgi:hypothetical protein
MLLTSDRTRPCRARFWRSSSGRVTTSVSPSRAMAGQLPAGPLHRDVTVAEGDLDAARDGDRLFADA